MLLWLILIVIVLLALGGAWGYPHYGYISASPLVIFAIILVLLVAFGVIG